MAECLELPRPLRLLRTLAWSLTESTGLPVAALAVGAWLGGRNAGLLAGVAATWLIAVIRKITTGSVPSLLKILVIEFTLQAALVIATRQLWIFLLHFPLANLCLCLLFARTARGPDPLLARLAAEVVGLRQPASHYPDLLRFFQGGTWLWAGIFLALGAIMSVLLVTEPVAAFLLGSAVATAALIAAGTGVSVLWLRHALRKAGLAVRFALAEPARGQRRAREFEPMLSCIGYQGTGQNPMISWRHPEFAPGPAGNGSGDYLVVPALDHSSLFGGCHGTRSTHRAAPWWCRLPPGRHGRLGRGGTEQAVAGSGTRGGGAPRSPRQRALFADAGDFLPAQASPAWHASRRAC